MGIGWQQLLIVAVIAVLLFGRGKISGLMGEVAQGIKSFKKGMKEDTVEPTEPAQKVTENADDVIDVKATEKKDT